MAPMRDPELHPPPGTSIGLPHPALDARTADRIATEPLLIIEAASGLALIMHFNVFDRPGPLALAAALAYCALLACAHLVLDNPDPGRGASPL